MRSGDNRLTLALSYIVAPESNSGFTLIEVLVVLTIIALSLSMITWVMKPIRDRNLVVQTIASFERLSEAARMRSLESDDVTEVSIDVKDRELKVASMKLTERLPREVAIIWVSAKSFSAEASRDATKASILFLPDGTSTGGKFSAHVGSAVASVRVSWVSGTIVDEP